MTFEEFLEKLKTKKWQFVGLRNDQITEYGHSTSCPYLAVYPQQNLYGDVICQRIWASADNATYSTFFDPEIRRRLLEACGLQEVQQ